MTRGAALALVALALVLAGHARAQVGRITPVSLGAVTFTVGDADLAAAEACPSCVVVEPDPGPPVVFDLRRQNPRNVYLLDVSLDEWTPAGGPTLEVRVTVTSTNGRTTFLQTDWVALTTAPLALFDQSQANRARVRVTASYRLRLAGDEPAGAYTSRVTYRIRDTTQAASHTARASLPTFLALRWVGAPASGATLRFDYAAAPLAYLRAIDDRAPLAPTSADFDRLEVATNHPGGYTVTLWITPLDAPQGAPSLVSRLVLAGAAADGRRFTSVGPTDGFVTLVAPEDFGLLVDGSEAQGAYRVELRYEAARNP